MQAILYFKRRPYCLITLVFFLFATPKVLAQEKDSQVTVNVPEPLNFDLVRGLGAKKGELEINTLADFPLNNMDARKVEWAPEIEYALFDNFAVELEFPFENGDLEAYKMAIQWTMGTSESNKFIHGIQVIGEALIHESLVELSFLYVPAYRFNTVWSAIGLFGVMVETGADAADKNSTILLNASLFADVNRRTVIGLELNNTDPTLQKIDDNEMSLIILPQVHYEFTHGWSLQFGIGANITDERTDMSGIIRLIKSF